MATITRAPASYILIAATLTLILVAVVTQRLGYTIVAIFVAAAAWLTLASVCFVFLMNAWGL